MGKCREAKGGRAIVTGAGNEELFQDAEHATEHPHPPVREMDSKRQDHLAGLCPRYVIGPWGQGVSMVGALMSVPRYGIGLGARR